MLNIGLFVGIISLYFHLLLIISYISRTFVMA